jgi:hypothetical protein
LDKNLRLVQLLAQWAKDEKANRIDPSNLLRDVEAKEEGRPRPFPTSACGSRVGWSVLAGGF